MKTVQKLPKITFLCLLLLPMLLSGQQETEMIIDNPQYIDAENTANDLLPNTKFLFKVTFADYRGPVFFQEVSGLDIDTEVVEYRHSSAKRFSDIKMPGMINSGNVTLKRAVFMADNNFWEWYQKIKMNTIKRETVIIQLLDDNGDPTMTWTLDNAWPVKISGTDLNSDADEVAIETLEIAHEGITVTAQ